MKFKKIELELNESYRKVLNYFFAYPTKEISLTELTNLVQISKTTANKIVKQFSQEKFLKIQTIGNVWRISCNIQHNYNASRKIPYNLELIYQSGIIDEILSNIKNSRTIILFGSYRKGDDIETSDIDIAVETLDNEEIKIIPLGTIPQLGFRKNVKVNIIKFSRNKININLFSNISNGIILYGFLEVKP